MTLHPNPSTQCLALSVCLDIMLWFILLQKNVFQDHPKNLYTLSSIHTLWLMKVWSSFEDGAKQLIQIIFPWLTFRRKKLKPLEHCPGQQHWWQRQVVTGVLATGESGTGAWATGENGGTGAWPTGASLMGLTTRASLKVVCVSQHMCPFFINYYSTWIKNV